MKRDMDLARKILFEIEKAPLTTGWVDLKFDDYTEEEVSFHVKILSEAGLIDAENIGHGATTKWKAKGLTWEGCEFLDAARDNGRWEQAKGVMSKVGGFGFEIIKLLLVELVKAQLNLPPR